VSVSIILQLIIAIILITGKALDDLEQIGSAVARGKPITIY